MTRFNPFLKPALHEELGKYIAGEQINPINIELSLTGKCNLACNYCFYKTEKTTEDMPISMLEDLVDDSFEIGVKAITLTGGGEPTIHPQFHKIVDYIYISCIQQGLITNGIITDYDPTQFEWVRVSASPKLTEKSLNKLRSCKTLGIAVNYNGDDAELTEYIKLAEQVDADYIQVRPVLNTKGQLTKILPPKISIPSEKLIISDYKFNDCNKKHNYSNCEAFHFTPFIWENGDVDVCGYMRNQPGYNLGSLKEYGINEIMCTAPSNVPVIESCQVCCKENDLNKLIDELRTVKDKNFI